MCYKTASDTKVAAYLFLQYEGQDKTYYTIRCCVQQIFATATFKAPRVALKN